jgi:hypothetical protein
VKGHARKEGANVMVIIGCEFHPGFQQIAMVDTEGGEVRQLRLSHKQEAEQFYGSLRGQQVLVGMEACGYTHWFEQMLGELGYRYQIGDAAQIRASYVLKACCVGNLPPLNERGDRTSNHDRPKGWPDTWWVEPVPPQD